MRFILNDEPVELPDRDMDAPLLWALRDELGLNGPKFGCGSGVCKACVVLLDGEPAPACVIPASMAEGREVTTLEGLGRDQPDGLHPVQRAWIAAQVPQCGYCQNGQIMTAVAAIRDNPGDPDAVFEALDEVLCRCGTHDRIRKAVLALMAAGGE